MAMPTTEVVSVSPDEPRSRTELVLAMIALRHQIAVLKRSGTRRPCFGFWDRLFWTSLSWWWPRWTESLLIIQPGKRLSAGAEVAGGVSGGIGHEVVGAADVPRFLARSAD